MIYPKRCYLDTSVIGGYYDPEFAEATRTLFGEIRGGRVTGVISNIVIEELKGAPEAVRDLVQGESKYPLGVSRETVESEMLAEAYLEFGIVGEKFLVDCRHVALASVERVDLLLSWNCRHIVHYDKIRLFNAVNIIRGYDSLEIRTPSEVIEYDQRL